MAKRTLHLDGFSPNVQDILNNFAFRYQIPKLSKTDALGIPSCAISNRSRFSKQETEGLLTEITKGSDEVIFTCPLC